MALRYLAGIVSLLLLPVPAAGQSASARIDLGNREVAALRPEAALVHYEAAIADDSSAGAAWWKAANMLLELAEFETDRTLRTERFARAELMAREGARLLPEDADARFVLGRAVGRVALERGARERLQAAGEIRREAEAALRLRPDHGGALHLLGRWHAEVMRLGAATRFMARSLLGGGEAIRGANWNDSIRLLEAAVSAEPRMLTHRLALADVYLDRGRRTEARSQLEAIVALPATAFNDAEYKRQAAERLARLR